MPIIPKPGDETGGGVIRGAVSSIAGNLSAQVKGAVAKEAAALRPGNLLGTVERVADLKTGGLVSKARDLLGIAKGARGEIGQESGFAAGVEGGGQVNDSGAWGALSHFFIGEIFPVTYEGTEIVEEGADLTVSGPATELQFESTLNWQSPFENSGPESKAPTIMAMLQTGQMSTVANALQYALPDGALGDFAKDMAGKADNLAKSLRGRTGITKLNSHQVFSGMPPVRLTFQLHLRAMTDAASEVVGPYQRLLEYAWPQKLAATGVLSEVIRNEDGFVNAMFPSEAPQLVGFRYGNNQYAPMVIESVSNTLDGPMDSSGQPIYRSVQLTLATLTALDKSDVAKIFTRST